MTSKAKGGRPSKGERRWIRSAVPSEAHDLFTQINEATGVTLGDLTAYYMLQGLNAERARSGLQPFDTPPHLQAVARQIHQSTPVQAELELGVA